MVTIMRLMFICTIATLLCDGQAASAATDIKNRAQDVSKTNAAAATSDSSSMTASIRRLIEYVRVLQATRPPLPTPATRPPLPTPGTPETRPPIGPTTPAVSTSSPVSVPVDADTITPTFSPTISPTGMSAVEEIPVIEPAEENPETAVPTFSPTISPVARTRPPRPPVDGPVPSVTTTSATFATTPVATTVAAGTNAPVTPFPTLTGAGSGEPIVLPELTIVPDGTEGPLGACEGECRNNEDCEDGLVCYQRRANETVPNCIGDGVEAVAYCADRPPNYLLFISRNPEVGETRGLCEGDCDGDEECEGDLICYSRDGFDPVPGCIGEGSENQDYCTTAEATLSPASVQTRPPIGAGTRPPIGTGTRPPIGGGEGTASPVVATNPPVVTTNPPVTPFPTLSGTDSGTESEAPSPSPTLPPVAETPEPTPAPQTPEPSSTVSMLPPSTEPPTAMVSMIPPAEPTTAPPTTVASIVPPTTEPPTGMVSMLPPPTTLSPTTHTMSPTRNITQGIFAKSSKLYKPPPGLSKAGKAAKSSKGAKSVKAAKLEPETISRPSTKSAKVSGKSSKSSTEGKSGKGSKKGDYLKALERTADFGKNGSSTLYRSSSWGIVFVATMAMIWR